MPEPAVSLKTFHIFFIAVSILCCLGLGVWAVHDYATSGDGMNLAMGLAAWVGCGVLVCYGIWFLKKLKGIGDL